jgi:hypothetical protein
MLVAAGVFAQRPTEATLKALGPVGGVKLTNIRYTSDTTGQADVTLEVFGGAVSPLKDASFTGLQLSGMDVQKLTLTFPAEARYPALGGALVIAKDSQLAYDATNGADPCRITGGGKLELPFINRNNQKVALGVPVLKFVTQPSPSLKIEGANVLGLADANDGIDLGGIALRLSSGVNATFFGPDKKWTFTIPQTKLELELPGALSADGKPLTFLVNNLQLSEGGDPTFGAAVLDPSSIKKLPLLGQTGFELSIKNGTLAMDRGEITGLALSADLALPQSVTDKSGNRVTLQNLNIEAKSGFLLSYAPPGGSPLELRWQGMGLKTSGLALDFTATGKASNATGVAANESWTGAFIPSATLELPAALGGGPGKPSTVNVTNFFLDGRGVSGTVTLTAGQTLTVGGFSARNPSGSLTLDANQVTEGTIRATLAIPKAGEIGVGVTVMSDGRFSVVAEPNQTLKLDGLGVDVKVQTARLSVDPNSGVGKFFLTGKLKFDPQKLPALGGAEVGITDMGFDTLGKVYLPPSGKLDLKEPLVIDLKAVKISGREIGFEAPNGDFAAIKITGGVQFPKDIPLTGDVEFKGLRIAKKPNGSPDPDVTVEGIHVDARMKGVGSLVGDIEQRRAPANAPVTDLGSYFSGKAQVQLDALKGAGLGLTLLISDKKAWFIGGNVQLPAAAALKITPSQPILALYGFAGGFGYNVAKKPGFFGRVTTPGDELIFNQNGALVQAGVLLGDVAGGAAWWGEINLTGSFTGPVVDEIELAGRVTFLNDPTKNAPRYVARTSEWDEMDRTGYLVLSLEPNVPRFTATAGIDFYIPTRSTALVGISGQSQLKFDPNARIFYIALGWPEAPSNLKPLQVELAKVAGKNLQIGAKGGLLLDFSGSLGQNLPERKINGRAFLDAYAKGDLGPVNAGVTLSGKINALMVYERAGRAVFPEFTGDGRVALDGWIQVPVLGKAAAGASLDAELTRVLLVLDGKAYADFDTVFGKKRFDANVKVEIKR